MADVSGDDEAGEKGAEMAEGERGAQEGLETAGNGRASAHRLPTTVAREPPSQQIHIL